VEGRERASLVRLSTGKKSDATGLNFPVASALSQPSAMAGYGANSD
jgi:hypothetical protein